MYRSIISVSLPSKIGSQIIGINMELDVANELVLNVYTTVNLYSTMWINVPDNIRQHLVC